ncbi:PREDICTED: acid phosphatase 1-like [Tarenaya hassleriana]|uniref:acid phosphatase 1-like n=1 Tax=Tarenaya hassleriana TaxID=28532 RepID=UPI00053C5F86|nr:PREDICTED: acid phosphatase 1-like [Tarenaya hassleriana]
MARAFSLSLALAFLFAGIVSARDWNILNQLRLRAQNDAVETAGGENGGLSASSLKGYCESWRINVEMHNIRDFVVVPQECVAHVKRYMTSSQYEDDVERAVDEVALYLASSCCSKKQCDGMDAWVFDVDDTLLSTIPYHKSNGFFGGEVLNATKFEEWMGKSKAPAVPHMKRLYHEIRKRGIKIFLVSSRKEYLRSATVDNLIQQGYYGWSNLLLRGLEDEKKQVRQYKAEMRTWLASQGYRIWGVMGDQWNSFAGCPSPKRTFKLPNSIYYVA